MYLDKSGRIPTVMDHWILRFFRLQIGPNGLRKLEIEVHPGTSDALALPWNLIAPLQPLIHDASADRLRNRLNETIKAREAAYRKNKGAINDSVDHSDMRAVPTWVPKKVWSDCQNTSETIAIVA